MPGICGFFLRGDAPPGRAADQTVKMGAPLKERHTGRVTTFSDSRFAVRNFRFQDRFREENQEKRVFLDGYLLNRGKLLEILDAEGEEADRDWDDEILAGKLYELTNGKIAECLMGSFNLCAYDAGNSQIELINCRHGARHLYYMLTPEFFAFSSEMKSLLELDGVGRKVDRLAIQDMFNFGYISGTRTFFEDIHLLEPGTILTVRSGSVDQRKYWDYSFANTEVRPPFDDMVEEGGRLIGQAVDRHLDHFGRVGVPLSGGLDSRTILSFASQKQKPIEVFHCAWYAGEERIARELCRLNGGNWHRFDPLQFDIGEVTREGMEISDGNIHCHQFWFLPVVREICNQNLVDVLLDGYLMDVFFGDTFLVLPKKKLYTDEEKWKIINSIWRRGRPIFVEKAFLPEFYREYEEANRATIEAGMARIDEPHLSNFIHRYSFANRSNRYSVALPNVQRQYVEYGYPGLDYELTDFFLRIPPAFKKGARFYRSILVRCFPELAQVPWIKTGRPLDRDKTRIDRLLDGRLPVRQIGTAALLRLSLGRLDWSHRADLNRHFRRDSGFRSFFMEILKDPRTHSRGIIDRRGAQRLADFVDRGWPVFTFIQSLVTVELWFRKFIDD
jgi:asparagine synthetase B (glutamine-hydrolysing)